VNIVSRPEMLIGAKLKDSVVNIARASALRHRVVALKGRWWADASGPLVGFRDSDRRPLALLPNSKKGYELYDPVENTTVPVTGSLARLPLAFR
jgi:hypothetical protein